MKTLHNWIHSRKGVYFVLAMMMGLLESCWGLPTNIYRDNLTLQEAQSLVSFQICVPGYIPPGIDPNPNIINQAEGPEIIQEENYIRLQYKFTDNHKKAFEVYQRFTNDKEFTLQSLDTITESIREGSKVDLLYWMAVGYLSESKIRSIVEQMKIEVDVFQTKQTVWLFYEIVDPEQYRSTKTYWVTNHVEYRILAYLPAEEIKAITQSMMNCATP